MTYNDRGGGGGGGESFTVTLASSCDFRQVSNALGMQYTYIPTYILSHIKVSI